METGGYDAKFVEDPSDYFKCIICHLVLKNPVMFVECGHRVCKVCFDQMKNHSPQTKTLCPHDRLEIDVTKVVEDKGISRAILDFKVQCNNYADGCVWAGELRDLDKHVSDSCSYEEKKNTSKLLEQLVQRVESCENKLHEKDEQIASLKQDICDSRGEVKNMQQQVIELTRKVAAASSDNDSKISSENKSQSEDEDKNLQLNVRDSQEKIKYLQKQVSELTEKLSAVSYDDDIESLQKHVMNVDEYVPGDRTVFTWRITNYSDRESEDIQIFSPRFYSRLSGHRFKLSAEWFGEKRGRLCVHLHSCKGASGEVVTNQFYMAMKLESTDKYGKKNIHETDAHTLFWAAAFDIEYDENTSEGYGPDNYLNMPALKKFIIDDVLTITCTLSEIYVIEESTDESTNESADDYGYRSP